VVKVQTTLVACLRNAQGLRGFGYAGTIVASNS